MKKNWANAAPLYVKMIMKHMLQFSLLVIGLIALCSCSTTPSSKAQTDQTDEFETIDSILNDRSKWVDPAFPSRPFYRQP